MMDDYYKAMFLGPKGENKDKLKNLILESIEDHFAWRVLYSENDPSPWSPEGMDEIQNMPSILDEKAKELREKIKRNMPWFSSRYLGHMNSDVVLAGIIGYFTAMLYNPNNVFYGSSPSTTDLEIELIKDFAKMLGFNETRAWGYLTAGGTLSNLYGLWVARNMKYHPLILRDIIRLVREKGLALDDISLPEDDWELLNLNWDEILKYNNQLIEELERLSSRDISKWYEIHNNVRRIREERLSYWMRNYPGVVITGGTLHYSLVKAIDILGLRLLIIPVDERFRMDLKELENKLSELQNIAKQSSAKPVVIAIVPVFGSVEEGAIDPIDRICELRDKFAQKGLYFPIHVDAAYGGYLRTMFIRDDGQLLTSEKIKEITGYEPPSYLWNAQAALAKAESITIDPHKMGYIPYPAGAVLFRDGRIKDIIRFDIPYLRMGGDGKKEKADNPFGPFTLEGSRAGAAAAAVWLANKVLSLNIQGYGKLVATTLINAQKFYEKLKNKVLKAGNDCEVEVFPLPLEGPDTNIICFILNIKGNNKIEIMNKLNNEVFKRFQFIDRPEEYKKGNPELYKYCLYDYYVSKTDFSRERYGEKIHKILQKIGIDSKEYLERGEKVIMIRMTLMHPWPLVRTDNIEYNYLDGFLAALEESLPEIMNKLPLPSKEKTNQADVKQ